ncbi:MAG: trypsin-like peptidase domain-containing protein [Cytophagales bacterium]|nr:trypsin-like peptidase domain-containing protein [Armatimonadota bacterium]
MGIDRRFALGAVPAVAVAGGLAATLLLGGTSTSVSAQSGAQMTTEQRDTATSLQGAFMKIADTVGPATVFITVKTDLPGGNLMFSPFGGGEAPGDDSGSPFGGDPFAPGAPFRRSQPNSPGGRTVTNSGSGVIVRPDGYILTNDHVVARAKNGMVTVQMSDGTEYIGKIYRDQRSDLAVVKITAGKPLPFVSFADSSRLRVGQWAIAIGSPFGEQNTMTAGIVSALNRKSSIGNGGDARYYPELIQTDASINPGNSGGPLLNIDGQMIGVNVAIESPSGTSSGIGFAIPANTAKSIMTQLIEKGKVVRGSLGIVPQDIPVKVRQKFGTDQGAYVFQVRPDTPAEKAGIVAGDVITQFNTTKITNEVTLRDAISTSAPGSTATIQVLRLGGKTAKVAAILTGQNEEVAAAPAPVPIPRRSNSLGFDPRPLTSELASTLRLPPSSKGLVVFAVTPGSPAADAELAQGMVITAVDNKTVNTVPALNAAIAAVKSGDVITFSVLLRDPDGGKPSQAVVNITIP